MMQKFPFVSSGKFGEFLYLLWVQNSSLCMFCMWVCLLGLIRLSGLFILYLKRFDIFMSLLAGIYCLSQRETKVRNTICIQPYVCGCVCVCDLSRQLIVCVGLATEVRIGVRPLWELVNHDSRQKILIEAIVCLIDLFKYLFTSIVKSKLIEIALS